MSLLIYAYASCLALTGVWAICFPTAERWYINLFGGFDPDGFGFFVTLLGILWPLTGLFLLVNRLLAAVRL